MELKFKQNEQKYYEYIRYLRTHKENINGFLDKVEITTEQQNKYMSKYGQYYYISLLDDSPCGYVGVIDHDIRICVDPNYKNMGIGTFLLQEIMKVYPDAKAKILKTNPASLALFKKCKFSIYSEDKDLFYLKLEKI